MKKNKIYDNRLRSEERFLNCRAKGKGVIAFSRMRQTFPLLFY